MTARRRYAFAAVVAAVAAAVPLVASHPPAAHAAPGAKTAFTFTDSRIDSSAGLAVLPDEPGYVFTINDHAPTRIFGIDPSTGHSAATMRLRDARVVDWEAIAPGQDRTLWVGDIGGSGSPRRAVTVYRFQLPAQLSTGYYSSTMYRLTYPDGPHDAQALLVDPSDGTAYVATYGSGGGNLYEARNLSAGGAQLRKVGSVPANVTDGAYRPDGKQFVLRTPDKAYVYSAPGKQIGTIALPHQRQGKGIAYTANGNALLLSGAGANSKVLRMKVSGALVTSSGTPTSSPGSTASPSQTAGSSSNDGDSGFANLAFIVGPFVIAAIAVLVALLFRKRTPGYEGGHGGGAGSRDYRRYERDEPYPPPPYGERDEPRPPPEQHDPRYDPRYEPAYDRYGDGGRPDAGGGGRPAGSRRRSTGRPRRPRRGKGDESVPFWLQD
ncbi:MAG TPA: hypothetical protein VF053_01925 [Streptosporangiales bacterium]